MGNDSRNISGKFMGGEMSAIEIYTKIMDAVKDAEPKDAYVAMNFARNEVESKFYQQRNASVGSGLLAYPQAETCCPTDVQAEAEKAVRRIVQEEIKGMAAPVVPETELAVS